ncbi:MAG: hypothetical protein FJY98_01155 [Candidatus Liptonbacteria bacterium]|nr:hypothetical protein [Candidatus Liptonbacteria bacterium]
MTWKKWPYWLRGGVIGGVIALISSILTHICEFQGIGLDCVLVGFPWLVLTPIFLWQLPFFNFALITLYPLTILIGIGIYFFLGSFVGNIIGYIKKRKY